MNAAVKSGASIQGNSGGNKNKGKEKVNNTDRDNSTSDTSSVFSDVLE